MLYNDKVFDLFNIFLTRIKTISLPCITLDVGDVVVEFSRIFGKGTKFWFITKVCLDAFTHHIAYIMVVDSALFFH